MTGIAGGTPPSDHRATSGDGAESGDAESSARGWRRWRAPVLVAAAVVLIAGVIVAVVARGAGGQMNPAAPGGSTAAIGPTAEGLLFAHHPNQNGGDDALLEGTVVGIDGCLVVVPEWDESAAVVPSFPLPGTDPTVLRVGDRVALGGGFADVDRIDAEFVIPDSCRDLAAGPDGYFIAWQLEVVGSDPTPDPDAAMSVETIPGVTVSPTNAAPPADAPRVGVPVDTSWAGTGSQHLAMEFGEEPGSVLVVTSIDTDADLGQDAEGIVRADIASDGTPLGYLRVVRSMAERPDVLDTGGSYLFGAVSPEVERLAVLATKETTDPAIAPGTYKGAEVYWIVADQERVSGDVPMRVLFTDLGEGWRAFAIQMWAPSPAVTVVAFGQDRAMTQARQFAAYGADAVDLPLKDKPSIDPWDPESPRYGADGPNGADGPYVATYPDEPGMPAHAALFEGTVLVRDGCLVATPAPGEEPSHGEPLVTLVFPQSQVEAATPPAVLNFRGQEYAEGEAISVAGSMFDTPPDDLPSICPTQSWSVSPYE